MSDLEKVLQVVNAVLGVFAPEVAGPSQAIGVIVKDALGVERAITAQARETEAGRSISKASHLAGLREAIGNVLYGAVVEAPGHDLREKELTDAIMREIERRL